MSKSFTSQSQFCISSFLVHICFWLFAKFEQNPHVKKLLAKKSKHQKFMAGKSVKRKGACFLCAKHNVPLCNHCAMVHCCRVHLSSHRQNDYCFPFKISHNGFIAVRDIQPLELILFEKALAIGKCGKVKAVFSGPLQ